MYKPHAYFQIHAPEIHGFCFSFPDVYFLCIHTRAPTHTPYIWYVLFSFAMFNGQIYGALHTLTNTALSCINVLLHALQLSHVFCSASLPQSTDVFRVYFIFLPINLDRIFGWLYYKWVVLSHIVKMKVDWLEHHLQNDSVSSKVNCTDMEWIWIKRQPTIITTTKAAAAKNEKKKIKWTKRSNTGSRHKRDRRANIIWN